MRCNGGPVRGQLGGTPVGAADIVLVDAAVVNDPLVGEGEDTGGAIHSLARAKKRLG